MSNKIRPDFSISSANAPTYANTSFAEDFKVYRCMVLKRYFVDDPLNQTQNSKNPQVIYDLVILGGTAEGQILSNARVSSQLGGNNNYQEQILKPIDPNKAKDLTKHRLSSLEGDVVQVVFLQGNKNFPLIIGMGANPQDLDKTGAKKADGTRKRAEYNGIFEEVNKDGEYEITRKGGEFNTEKIEFIPSEDENTFTSSIQLQKEKTFHRDTKQIEFQIGPVEDPAYTQIIKAEGESYTRDYKSGLSIIEDGQNDKLTFSFNNGMVLTLDGKSDKMELKLANGLKLEADGTADAVIAKTAGGGSLNITADKVALGTTAIELLNLLDQLLQEMQQETHIGNLGVPTGTPINALQYAAIQSLLQTIKGVIA